MGANNSSVPSGLSSVVAIGSGTNFHLALVSNSTVVAWGANAYGQILLGLDRPAADVSRGSNAHDILGVSAIVGVQATAYKELYPEAGQVLPGDTSE